VRCGTMRCMCKSRLLSSGRSRSTTVEQ